MKISKGNTDETQTLCDSRERRARHLFREGIDYRLSRARRPGALSDVNPLRMRGFNEYLETCIPAFTDFGAMVQETAPTHAIVCSPDRTHDAMIEQAFCHGLEVICETNRE